MHCFNHPQQAAIGICKGCHKGLCNDCAIDLGHGLACKGEHEDMVNTYHAIVDTSANIYSAAPKNAWLAPIFLVLMGSVFAVFGLLSKQGFASLGFVMGCGFALFGAVLLLRTRRLYRGSSAINTKPEHD